MDKTHIVSRFDKELKEIDSQLQHMAQLVIQQLADATEALVKKDVKLAKKVRKGDRQINDLEDRILELTTRLIALRQPMAEDLRSAITTFRVASDLERIGDYAKTISNRTAILAEEKPIKSATKTIKRMSIVVQAMLGEVMEAYVERDLGKAEHARVQDEDVDQMNSALFRELLTYMMENPRNIEASTHLLFIAKTLERAGDHVTNVAEHVYFLVTGEQYENEVIEAD
jgi:phosphate transport system protein